MSTPNAKYKKIVRASKRHETAKRALFGVTALCVFMGLSFTFQGPASCWVQPKVSVRVNMESWGTWSSFTVFSAVSRYTALPERLLCRVQYSSCSSNHSKSCLEASVLCPSSGEISLKEETSSGPPNLTVEWNHFVGKCRWMRLGSPDRSDTYKHLLCLWHYLPK